MPGEEQKNMNRAENHARSAIIPGDCKELSKETKQNTYDSNQARTKPWPTPTADLQQLKADDK